MNPAWSRYPADEPDFEDEADYEEPYEPEVWRDAHPDIPLDDPHLVRLGALVGFGPDDLTANQHGVLTETQIKLLEQDIRPGFYAIIATFSGLAFVIGLIGALVIGSLAALLPSILCMILALAGAAVMRYQIDTLPQSQITATDIKLGRFAAMFRQWGIAGKHDGKATFNLGKGKKLVAPDSLNKLLQANRDYRAYYVAHRFAWSGYRMLSIEPLGAPPADPITWYEKSKRDKKKKRG